MGFSPGEKQKVLKHVEEKRHKHGLVKHGLKRVSEAWIKLKNSIIKVDW